MLLALLATAMGTTQPEIAPARKVIIVQPANHATVGACGAKLLRFRNNPSTPSAGFDIGITNKHQRSPASSMRAGTLCCAAVVLLLLCMSLMLSTCSGQTISYTAFAGSGNSSAASAQSATTKMLSVLFTLAPCSGLQLHVQ